MNIVAVIGLGTMGLGIAQVFAAAGFRVLATDSHSAARDTALKRMAASLQPRVDTGKVTLAQRDVILSRVKVLAGSHEMGAAGLAIEAVAEDLHLKRAIFSALEHVMDPNAVLASNTSSLSVAALAEGLAYPSRVVGLHFFNPAPAMKLVELIAHAGTDPSVMDRVRAMMGATGKVVVECPDRPGFIVNRCARPFYGEALAMLEEGRAPGEVDAAMVAAGYRVGPFSLIDLVGADINLAATESLFQAMGRSPRYHVFAALRDAVASGRLGRKSGRGFFYPDVMGNPPADANAIVLRIEATLANEAMWLLAEGGTTRDGIDTALKLGLNFPRGPFESLAAHGVPTIMAELAERERTAPVHLKGRYLPPPQESVQ